MLQGLNKMVPKTTPECLPLVPPYLAAVANDALAVLVSTGPYVRLRAALGHCMTQDARQTLLVDLGITSLETLNHSY